MDIDSAHGAKGEAQADGGTGDVGAASRGGAPGAMPARGDAGGVSELESDDWADGLVKAAPGEVQPGGPQEVSRMADGDRVRFPDGRGGWQFGLLYGDPEPEDGLICVLCGQGRKATVRQVALVDVEPAPRSAASGAAGGGR